MEKKTYPILEYPGDDQAIIEPKQLYSTRPRAPSRCVLCFFADLLKRWRAAGDLEQIATLPGEGEPTVVLEHREGGEPMAVVFPGMGAPLSASILEEMIALGSKAFVCVGGAGVLDGAIPVGTVMIPIAALRDEGTSYHYQRRGRWSRPHPKAVEALRESCRARGIEPSSIRTWTTDGVYRETKAKIRRRREEGCMAVEMEAAAFFAVADFRKVTLGQLLYAGDDVSGDRWEHRDWNTQDAAREQLFEMALDAVRRIDLEP